MFLRQTHTYAVLTIPKPAWLAIHAKLIEAEVLQDYLDGNGIVFGTVRLEAEPEQKDNGDPDFTRRERSPGTKGKQV